MSKKSKVVEAVPQTPAKEIPGLTIPSATPVASPAPVKAPVAEVKQAPVKAVLSPEEKQAKLNAAREAYFKKMGFGKYKKAGGASAPKAKKEKKAASQPAQTAQPVQAPATEQPAAPKQAGTRNQAERINALSAAREAWFRKMGYGKYKKQA